jgi:Lrp/AsnC family transcriptional regulator, leucine-responsive regulatory protein
VNVFTNAFMRAVSKLPEVIACYITSGESDFWLHVMGTDLVAYRLFAVEKLTRVPGIRDMRSSFVIGTVKEGTFPLPAELWPRTPDDGSRDHAQAFAPFPMAPLR